MSTSTRGINPIVQKVIHESRQCRYLNPTQLGAYVGQDHAKIVATLRTLQHFRAFLASDCQRMIDPYSGWMHDELDKRQAQHKLGWLVNVAINRKAGIADAETDWPLVRFARNVNTPRLIVRERECPKRYRARLEHRLTREEDL